jgi:hypothetical protein
MKCVGVVVGVSLPFLLLASAGAQTPQQSWGPPDSTAPSVVVPPNGAPSAGTPLTPTVAAPNPYAPPFAETERTANTSIYAEGLGPAFLYSINLDRIVGDFAIRVGFSYLSLTVTSTSSSGTATDTGSLLLVPITVSYLGIGSKKNMLELGAGATIIHVHAGASLFGFNSSSESASASETTATAVALIGYRLQPPGGGFMMRVGLSPIIASGFVIALPYIALGGAF